MTPTRLGTALLIAPLALVAFLGGTSAGAVVGFLLFLGVLLTMITDALLARHPADEVFVRQVPSWIAVGRAARVTLALKESNTVRLRRVRDLPDRGLGAKSVMFDLEFHNASAEVTYELCPRRRGTFAIDGAFVECSGRLGLVWRWHFLSVRSDVRVLPDLRALTGTSAGAPLWRRSAEGPRQHRRPGAGSEVERLRDYEPTDDPRLIDWKATARHLSPITRQLNAERGRPVLFVLDAGRWMAAPIFGLPRFDHGLGAALVVGQALADAGDPVGYLVFSDRPVRQVPPTRGNRISPAGRVLFDVEAERVATDYDAMFRRVLTQQRRRTLIVLMTDLSDPTTVRALAQSLSALFRRHDVVCVHLTNPEDDQFLGAKVTTLDALARRVVLERMNEERRRAVALLRAQRATVIEVSPADLQSELWSRLRGGVSP